MAQDSRAVIEKRRIEKRRPHYDELLADGLSAFFEEERDDCPFCGGGGLRPLLRTPDRFQRKPGLFRLDECGGCGLVFQNPRLSGKGLDYFRPVRVERAPAHIPVDFLSTTALAGLRLMPSQVAPWTTATGRWREVVRTAMFVAFLPLLALAFAADLAWAPLARRGHRLSNVYAVIARRED